MREVITLAKRELAAFFHSSIAYIFIAAFLAVSLFVVFWVDAFFARNLADITPLFQWMPLLLIFLVSAITMRMWSEERRSGTLEALMTTPVSITKLVLGKFLACLLLVIIALVLTLGLPITVSFIGPLDWGPVIGGYVAAILLASAYIAVGLFVSSRTSNQIVSLIVSVVICLALYLPGSHLMQAFFAGSVAHFFDLIGTGSRFDSITRGVLDLRDLYYYLSLAAVFLVLNVVALTCFRQGKGEQSHKRAKALWWFAGLLIANLLLANVWLQGITQARIDLTQGNVYTLSSATKNELKSLPEPLMIEGIFSKKTHPLLAPLVPHLKNLMREYGISGGGNVTVKFIDPQTIPGKAKELAKKYAIQPVPFRNRSRYEASVVNAYFDVLIKYGDQYKVLSFQDLIDVARKAGSGLQVDLKSPEYTLTSAIKSVVGKYQQKGNVFNSITQPVTLHAYISANSNLPGALVTLKKQLQQQLKTLKGNSHGLLNVKVQNPDADGGKLADVIAKKYGFQPMVSGLFDPTPFYFYLLLQSGSQTVPVPLPGDLKADSLKKAIVSGLSQFATGMRKTVTVFAPNSNPSMARFRRHSGPQFTQLLKALRKQAVVKTSDLKSGQVTAGTQLLLVLAPNNISDKQLYAIDQFLMTGGRVVVAASPYQVSTGRSGLTIHQHKTGLADWLAQKGITIKQSLVLDKQSTTMPVPVYQRVGGLMLREYYPMPYPYFAYITGDGLNHESPVTRSLGQVTLSWASPIVLDSDKLKGDTVTRLLSSSPKSWLSSSTQIMPEQNAQGQPIPFTAQGKSMKSRLLAVAVKGQFTSWFATHPNPFAADKSATKKDGNKQGKPGSKTDKHHKAPVIRSVIKHSPAASRLVVISSPSFAADNTLNLIGAGLGRRYDQPVKLVQNLVSWSLESPAMLVLRDKSSHSRLLLPLDHGDQVFWEYLNYILALFGLIITGLIAWGLRRKRRNQLEDWLTKQGV